METLNLTIVSLTFSRFIILCSTFSCFLFDVKEIIEFCMLYPNPRPLYQGDKGSECSLFPESPDSQLMSASLPLTIPCLPPSHYPTAVLYSLHNRILMLPILLASMDSYGPPPFTLLFTHTSYSWEYKQL